MLLDRFPTTTTLASALNAQAHILSLCKFDSWFSFYCQLKITYYNSSLIHHTETQSNDRRYVYGFATLTQHLVNWLCLFAFKTPRAHVQLVSTWFGSTSVTFSVAYCTLQLLLLLRLIFLTGADDIFVEFTLIWLFPLENHSIFLDVQMLILQLE